MEYQIIVDSCVDFNEEVFGDPSEMKRIPFQLLIDDEALTDEGLDSDELIRKMKASKRKISTACPSLHDYLEAYKTCAVNYVVTISSRLSGSFQSAMAAKQMLEESGSDSKVYVIDSKTAAAGQTLVALQLKRMLEQQMESTQILLRMNQYIANLQTLFVPVSLNNLEKNGRIKGIQVIMSKVLHIIPILGANKEGTLELKDKARGEAQAMEKLMNLIRRDAVNMTETVLAITHVDARAKAEELCEKIKSLFTFKEVIIFQASGLSTVYADDGGIVLSF
ncbi:MAG: DegV family protein [Clostridium sp.]|uniref:DegV family protein n=1 Tax=Clostridium sp. TaxID=1506 RepID=UPI00290B72B1|nr:DegV family protein [Clostridium sp.]MDU7336896.1 DegV family protein [Clostridium sp.]